MADKETPTSFCVLAAHIIVPAQAPKHTQALAPGRPCLLVQHLADLIASLGRVSDRASSFQNTVLAEQVCDTGRFFCAAPARKAKHCEHLLNEAGHVVKQEALRTRHTPVN
eukprot:g9479.t1